MRTMPASMSSAWREGLFVGSRRPIARVTVAHPKMELRNYSLTSTYGYRKDATLAQILAGTGIDLKAHTKVSQCYANFLFATANKAGVVKHTIGPPKELPNVKSVSWTRSTDADVADCTIVVMNTAPIDPGSGAPRTGELDLPGYYTYDRGATAFSKARWGQTPNEWFGMLVPDNLIRTYEGYGCDMSVVPELDAHLVQTGLWIIDSVQSTDSGSMTIKCRDVGRILMDQIYYQPVVPKQFYDAKGWSNWDQDFPADVTTQRLKVSAQDSSNTPWIGNSITHSVAGHKLQYAFDGDPSSFWLSIGNVAASKRFAYEWVQCRVSKQSVNQVRVRTKKKGYTCYVSVKVGGVWQGTSLIDYHEDGIGMNGGDIKYVTTAPITTESWVKINLDKTYKKVEAVRITLGNLQYFPQNYSPYHYRAGIRDVEVHGPVTKASTTKLKVGPIGSNPGRYYDYTDLVKLLCAWGGFFWPENSKLRDSNGTYHAVAPQKFDTRVLGAGVRGRVWGDFQNTTIAGPAELDASNFDKQSLMDGIAFIRDQLGFLFFIDETGAVQWRLPNITNYGCLRGTLSPSPKYLPGYAHQIDENTVLLQLQSTVDSENVREAFFVGDVQGKLGAFAPGFNPNPTGLRRIGGWMDQNFAIDPEGGAKDPAGKNAEKQAQLMADMISLRQLFSYRTDSVRIPGYPAIQVDDQIRIFERTTSEGYLHYVKGISSSLDMSTGSWTYDLNTHWLGYDRPNSKWLFRVGQLYAVTQEYLERLSSANLAKTEAIAESRAAADIAASQGGN